MRYDYYLELEDMAERNETTVEAELQEAIELTVLTSQYMIDMRLDEAADWIDVVERSLLYNSGLNDEN